MKTYSEDTVKPELSKLKGWSYKENAIEKDFVLKNFVDAVSFMIKIGFAAEKKNHHPELINVYNKLKIRLSTHDAGGVTDKDLELANEIEQLV